MECVSCNNLTSKRENTKKFGILLPLNRCGHIAQEKQKVSQKLTIKSITGSLSGSDMTHRE